MAFWQVYQSNKEECRLGILVAPNDNRAGHKLMKDLRVDDVIFHYNSSERGVFAVSRVPAYDFAVLRDFANALGNGIVAVGRPQGSNVAIIYKGPHLLLDRGTSEHLLAKVEVLKEGKFGGNLAAKSQTYLVKVPKEVGEALMKEHGIPEK